MPSKQYAILVDRLKDLSYLGSALGLLHWDQEVHMPPAGAEMRARTIGYLSGRTHEQFLALDKDKLLSKLAVALKDKDTAEAASVRDVWRSYRREKKLPVKFVREFSELCSEAHVVWAKARETSDFSLFQPLLEKIVAMKRQEAEYVGYKDSPYDALLDAYEPGATCAQLSPVFSELRDFLQPFIRRIVRAAASQPSLPDLKGTFPIEKQKAFNALVAEKMGFSHAAGKIDVSTHPFTMGFHPQDVRITTRYDERDALYAIGSTVHEVGHALYEQGLPVEHFGTPLGEAVSLGLHESQSRVWENQIGKGRAFWTYFYPKLQKAFPKPFKRVVFEDFFRIVNQVRPSLIRTESDEVTYNLHIILRYEIEKGLIEENLKVKDLPGIWKAKMKEYLGVCVPDDRQGVLQDVHWSGGSIGYFPTYTLGNLYAAQFYAAALRELPRLQTDVAKGRFAPVREWLRQKIHVHGKLHSAQVLVKNVTGEELSSRYFIEYLKTKYGELYGV